MTVNEKWLTFPRGYSDAAASYFKQRENEFMSQGATLEQARRLVYDEILETHECRAVLQNPTLEER
jgi:hypothetical protein